MTPVAATINGEKRQVTRQNFRGVMAEVGAAAMNQ